MDELNKDDHNKIIKELIKKDRPPVDTDVTPLNPNAIRDLEKGFSEEEGETKLIELFRRLEKALLALGFKESEVLLPGRGNAIAKSFDFGEFGNFKATVTQSVDGRRRNIWVERTHKEKEGEFVDFVVISSNGKGQLMRWPRGEEQDKRRSVIVDESDSNFNVDLVLEKGTQLLNILKSKPFRPQKPIQDPRLSRNPFKRFLR